MAGAKIAILKTLPAAPAGKPDAASATLEGVINLQNYKLNENGFFTVGGKL